MQPYVARLEAWERTAIRSWSASIANRRSVDPAALADLEQLARQSRFLIRNQLVGGARTAGARIPPQ